MLRYTLIFLGLLIVLTGGLALRLGVDLEAPLEVDTSVVAERQIWYDESDTWEHAVDRDYDQFIRWTHHHNHAPLQFALSKIWIDIRGGDVSPFTLRLPSLTFGMLSIVAIFALGWVAHRPETGLIAAALLAVAPNAVDQSQQARVYTFLALMGILAAIWIIVILRRPDRSPWHAVGLGVVLGLAYWAHPLSLALWGAVPIATGLLLLGGWIARQPHPDPWRAVSRMSIALLVAGLMSYVGVWGMATRFLVDADGKAPTPVSKITYELMVAASDLVNLHAAGLIVYLIAAAGVVLLFRKCKTSAIVLATIGILGVLIVYPTRQRHHFLAPRYLTLVEPTLLVGLAMLPTALCGWGRRLTAGVVVLAIAGVFAWNATHLQDWWMQPDRYLVADMIEKVDDQRQPGDAIVYHPMELRLMGKYYDLAPTESVEHLLYENFRLRPDDQLTDPARPDAQAVWLMVGMVNFQGRIDRAWRAIDALAAAYDVTPPRDIINDHLQLERAVAIRIAGDGFTVISFGLDRPQPRIDTVNPTPPAPTTQDHGDADEPAAAEENGNASSTEVDDATPADANGAHGEDGQADAAEDDAHAPTP